MKTARLSFIQFLTLCAIFAATVRPASADWQLTPFIGLTFKGHTSLVDSELASDDVHWNFGGAAAFLGRGLFGAEAHFTYTPRFLDDPKVVPPKVTHGRTLALMGNVVVTAPLKWNEFGLRPFVSGGLGLLRVSKLDVPPQEVFSFTGNMLGFNIGGGAIGFVSDRAGLRFDLRYTSTLRDTEPPPGAPVIGLLHLRYWTAGVGVVFRLGAPPSTRK